MGGGVVPRGGLQGGCRANLFWEKGLDFFRSTSTHMGFIPLLGKKVTSEMALIGLKSIYLRFPCGVPFIAPPAVQLTGGA